MDTHRYSTPITRLAASLVASFFITLHGRWDEIGKALVTPGFYYALLASICISYLLMYWVHFVNFKLGPKYPILHRPWSRIALQIVLGIIPASVIDIVVVTVYFKIVNRDIISSGYLEVDFPIVVLFLVLLSAYYLAIDALSGKAKPVDESKKEMLLINYNGNHLQLNVSKDILYFYRDGKLVRLCTVSGQEYSLKDTITNLTKKYSGMQFCQINPSALMNLEKLKGYTAGTKRDTLRVLFKVEYHELTAKQNQDLLRVTKEHLQNFKNKFEMLEL